MSLLSGLFTNLEKVPAPRLVTAENVARMASPATPAEITGNFPASTGPSRGATAQLTAEQDVRAETRSKLSASSHHPPSVDVGQQHIVKTAATASPEWRQTRDQHINHLMACRACHAPVGRYCPAGAELRQRYDQTPMAPTEYLPHRNGRPGHDQPPMVDGPSA